ncbi:MAG: diguanylate cyclase [Firmicutes bacterium]|jgi:diguanylate cyclase (GGDEF)-like protein|nr:diguanylate cyclase [Bacillota bacterium]
MDNKILSNFLIISTLLLINLAVYGYRKREIPGARYFGYLILAMVIHTLSYAMELTASTVEGMFFWIRMEYIGASFYPFFLILFVREYTDDTKLFNNIIVKIMGIENLFTLLLVFTSKYHTFYYKSLGVDNTYGFNTLAIEKGVWYNIHAIILMFSFIYALVIFIKNYMNSKGVFKKRIGFMIAGFSIPMVTFFIYFLGFGPAYIDLCPFAYLLMSAMGIFGFFNYSTLFYVPINHSMILDSMDQAVFVVDNDDFIVSCNRNSKIYFKSLEKIKLGEGIENIMELKSYDIVDGLVCKIDERTLKFKIIDEKKHNGRIFVITDITEQELRKRQLEIFANEDSLTGLYNRRCFMEKINDSREGVFAILDIDHFKRINDNYGHFQGDTVLNVFARKLKRNFSEYTVCRYGGEEFALYTEHKNVNQVYKGLENFRKSVAKEDYPFAITFSAGISFYNEGNVNEGILKADEKLYEAKNDGRNCVKF